MNTLEDKPHPYVQCKACKTVHFRVSLEYANAEITRFNEFYKTLPGEAKEAYGGESSIRGYMRCIRCGGSYRNFKDFAGDIDIYGKTINPILDRRERHGKNRTKIGK